MEAARAPSLSSPLGRISISHEAVAQIVGRVAAEAYGVVGMAAYGLNLAEVASSLRNRMQYEVERLTGLPVAAIEVRIQDAKRSTG